MYGSWPEFPSFRNIVSVLDLGPLCQATNAIPNKTKFDVMVSELRDKAQPRVYTSDVDSDTLGSARVSQESVSSDKGTARSLFLQAQMWNATSDGTTVENLSSAADVLDADAWDALNGLFAGEVQKAGKKGGKNKSKNSGKSEDVDKSDLSNSQNKHTHTYGESNSSAANDTVASRVPASVASVSEATPTMATLPRSALTLFPHMPSASLVNPIGVPVTLNDDIRTKMPNAAIGLAKMCASLLELDIDKQMQISQWTEWPLSSAQAHYAATDAYIVTDIIDAIALFAYEDTLEEALHDV